MLFTECTSPGASPRAKQLSRPIITRHPVQPVRTVDSCHMTASILLPWTVHGAFSIQLTEVGRVQTVVGSTRWFSLRSCTKWLWCRPRLTSADIIRQNDRRDASSVRRIQNRWAINPRIERVSRWVPDHLVITQYFWQTRHRVTCRTRINNSRQLSVRLTIYLADSKCTKRSGRLKRWLKTK